MPEKSITGMARIVSMPQEMLNDAKWYLSQAEQAAIKDPQSFALWREVRATVMFAIASIESFINGNAHVFLRGNGSLDQATKDYLTESRTRYKKGSLETEPNAFVALEEKLTGWTKVMAGKEFPHADKVWKDFKDVLDFRNELVHFKVESSSQVYAKGDVTMANRAVEAAQAIIERFYQTLGNPVPGWVRAAYREIK